MKKFIQHIYTVIALLVVSSTVFAQQIPLYSQYYFNKFIYNPALTGHSGQTEANIFGRNQYTGIDGFQTAGASVSGQVSDGKVGLGLYAINDANFLQTQNSVYGNYAYNIKMSETNTLSLGFGLGVLNNRFNTENIIATNPDDPAVRLLNNRPGAIIDASIGMNLKADKFQFGLSVPQFLGSSQEFTDQQQASLLFNMQNHLMIMTSYDIVVSDDLMIQPLFLYKNTKNAPGQFDINVIADWMNRGWLGAGYRDGYGATLMGGIRIADKLRFGYSYDWSMGDYSQALGGAHEVLLGITLNQTKDAKPSKEEMDKLRMELAKKQSEDNKDQAKKIEELENKLNQVEASKRQKDTVYIVQKVVTNNVPTPTEAKPEKHTDPRPTKPTNDSKDQNVSGDFIVVAGSFSEEANATKYFNQLVNKGLSPYMYYSKTTRVYYVHLGRFYFKEEARSFASDKSTGTMKLWVKTLR